MQQLITFDAMRAAGVQGVRYVKPDQNFVRNEPARGADWVLFPQTWQVNALVYALRKRIFPSPAGQHLGYDKIEMTRAIRALVPEHVPETLILPSGPSAMQQVIDALDFPLVVLPAGRLRSRATRVAGGVFRVDDRATLRRVSERLEVLYAQELLEMDRDLRVVWVGDRVIAACSREGGDGFHHNLAAGARLSFAAVPAQAVALVERIARALGLNYAGFDIAVVDGWCYMLQFNLFFGNDGTNARGVRLGPEIRSWLERQASPDHDTPPPALSRAS
ncbi:MAG TPA: hypothetical protein VFA86_03910 [Gammaproteobacteria bacterium]|nr:hypothetical protein [Gammaproteobacteria bacterium]